jgi:hypothetical protein
MRFLLCWCVAPCYIQEEQRPEIQTNMTGKSYNVYYMSEEKWWDYEFRILKNDTDIQEINTMKLHNKPLIYNLPY